MIEKIEPELIDDSFLLSFDKNLILNQDKTNKDIDKQVISNNITKRQKEYINYKNKYFFFEFDKLYTTNIILKNKLNDVLNEKKRLNQLIIKLEHQVKNSKKINYEKTENDFIMNNRNKNTLNIEPYRKKKRKRERKRERTRKRKRKGKGKRKGERERERTSCIALTIFYFIKCIYL